MPEHASAVMVRSTMEALNRGDMAAMAEALSDDVVWHEIGNPEPVRGKAALASRMSGPGDFEITGRLHDVVANDDHAIALVDVNAKRGDRTLDYRTAEIFHVRDGKIVERWAFSDDTAAIMEFFR